MSGIVSNIYICPKCQSPMTAQVRPERCPSGTCNYRFRKPDEKLTKGFHWPKAPDEQLFELVQQDMDRFFDKPLDQLFRSMFPDLPVPADLKDAVISNHQRHEFIRDYWNKKRDQFFTKTHVSDIEGYLKCIHYLMTLSIPSGNLELIRTLAIHGKEIGKFAEVLENYLKFGGRVYEGKET